MFNYRVLAILKRELRERVLSKSFIITTLSLPLIMALVLGLQYFMMTMEGDKDVHLIVACESSDVITKIEKVFNTRSWIESGDYTVSYQHATREDFSKLLEENKEKILDRKLTGVIFVPESALKDKKIELYAEGTKNITLERKLSSVMNEVFMDHYFKDRGFSAEDLQFTRQDVELSTYKITKGEMERETGGNLVLTYLFTFLLYISLLMMGTWIMQSVLEEKANRICEVILSSVDSRDLMMGKIFGSSFTGLLQMIIWLTPVMVVIGMKLPILPVGMLFQVDPLLMVYYMFNFLLGLITFVGLFAAVGAIFNNAQEAQGGVTPIMMLIIIPFLITMSLITNPINVVAGVSSMLPFASIIVMPARMTLTTVPVWQIILSIVVNIATILVIIPIAGKIYRVGILRTGKKPSYKEVLKWLKEA